VTYEIQVVIWIDKYVVVVVRQHFALGMHPEPTQAALYDLFVADQVSSIHLAVEYGLVERYLTDLAVLARRYLPVAVETVVEVIIGQLQILFQVEVHVGTVAALASETLVTDPDVVVLGRLFWIIKSLEAVGMIAILAAVAMQQVILLATYLTELARRTNPVEYVGIRFRPFEIFQTVRMKRFAAHIAVQERIAFLPDRATNVTGRLDAYLFAAQCRITVFPHFKYVVVHGYVPEYEVTVLGCIVSAVVVDVAVRVETAGGAADGNCCRIVDIAGHTMTHVCHKIDTVRLACGHV
jgi:hypothetical protein